MPIYCGNNRKSLELINGTHVIGTRYGCLKKGIGIGSRLPSYEVDYQPIDKRRVFCGKGKVLKNGYDRLGSNSECLRKGIGIGKSPSRKGKIYNKATKRWVKKDGRVGKAILKAKK